MYRLLALVCCLIGGISCFPDGAPIGTCARGNSNHPSHSGAKEQPLASNPYTVEASSNYYKPGDQITVKIVAPSGVNFRGFFLQAKDGKTNDWIGSFAEGPEAKSYPDCSAATHTNASRKQSLTLTWTAPPQGSGNVYFTATIVNNYSTYWADIVANLKP